MTSVFTNPNVFAGCVGIGVLLSLGLAVSAQKKAERAVHLSCLFVSALAFLLAFSMGASGVIALAFLAYLLLEKADRRPALLLLMVETLVITVAAAAVVSTTSFSAWSGFQPVPLLCVAAGAAALGAGAEVLQFQHPLLWRAGRAEHAGAGDCRRHYQAGDAAGVGPPGAGRLRGTVGSPGPRRADCGVP